MSAITARFASRNLDRSPEYDSHPLPFVWLTLIACSGCASAIASLATL